MSNESATSPPPRAGRARRLALGAILGIAALAALAYGAYWALVLSHYEHTDNAYVQGDVVQITPQVAGTVTGIAVDEMDRVKAGQVLLRLDAADARVALEQAEAQLAQTVREVRTLYANNATFESQIAARQAEVTRAQADAARAQDDVDRRKPLVAGGAVGQEEFAHAERQLAAARGVLGAALSARDAARAQLASNRSLTDGIRVEQHPSVLRAVARMREAWLALKRTELPSPIDGHVAKRSVQLGQRVQPGTPLMTVVALDRLWVDANFKEAQLRSLRIGQPATLQADVYGGKVTYHGTVQGLGTGTGAAFALLPAQNATGNWIKIVQRVPVRIALDAKELAEHPLRVGLSMEVQVDIGRTEGASLAEAPRTQPLAQTRLFDAPDPALDAEVARIVAGQLGRDARRP
ncbi:MAG: efflux RND transporter periplasmic adaptor subunit [Burkholderiaceae bacterium]